MSRNEPTDEGLLRREGRAAEARRVLLLKGDFIFMPRYSSSKPACSAYYIIALIDVDD